MNAGLSLFGDTFASPTMNSSEVGKSKDNQKVRYILPKTGIWFLTTLKSQTKCPGANANANNASRLRLGRVSEERGSVREGYT